MQVYRIIPSDVNIIRVRNTLAAYNGLSVNTRDLGTLCQSATSKWAKYKPVRYNNVSNVTNWWKDNTGNCGLEIPIYGNISQMFTALRAGTQMWNYLTPRGNTYNEPYRLLDFAGYDSEATSPLIASDLNDKYYASFGTMPVALDLRNPTEYELALSDITGSINLADLYFGVAICKTGTTGYKYMTESITIGLGGDGGINVPISNELGTYEVVFFLCESPKASFSDPDIVNRFVPIPNAMKNVTIETSSIGTFVSGTFSLQEAFYSITLQNYGSIPVNINGCNIAFRYGDNETTEPLEMGEKTKSLGDVVVPANSSLELTGSIVAVGVDYDTRGGYLWFSNLTNSKYNARGDFEM